MPPSGSYIVHRLLRSPLAFPIMIIASLIILVLLACMSNDPADGGVARKGSVREAVATVRFQPPGESDLLGRRDEDDAKVDLEDHGRAESEMKVDRMVELELPISETPEEQTGVSGEPRLPRGAMSRARSALKSDEKTSREPLSRSKSDFKEVPVEYATAFVLLAHDRTDYITRTLDKVLKARNVEKFTIFVSVDRDNLVDMVRNAISESVANPNQIPITFLSSELPFADVKYAGEPSITRHFASVFHQIFSLKLFEYVLLLEDDLDVSPDFFDYFSQTGPLLHPFHPTARKLYCVSAWNDHGFDHLDLDPTRVFRNDWYPGLAVLFHRSMWVGNMEHEWPIWHSVDWGYDNWLRFRSTIAKTHDCLAPELSRIHHYSTRGTHVGGHASNMYERMSLSDGTANISPESLKAAATSLTTREYFRNLIRDSEELSIDKAVSRGLETSYQGKSVVVYFEDNHNLRDPAEAKRIYTKFNIFPFQFRMRFRGALTFKLQTAGTRVTIVANSMKDYYK